MKLCVQGISVHESHTGAIVKKVRVSVVVQELEMK